MKSTMPELTHDNIDVMINVLKERGIFVVNQPVNAFIRYLHSLKYDV
jgi:hypothetical protein